MYRCISQGQRSWLKLGFVGLQGWAAHFLASRPGVTKDYGIAAPEISKGVSCHSPPLGMLEAVQAGIMPCFMFEQLRMRPSLHYLAVIHDQDAIGMSYC